MGRQQQLGGGCARPHGHGMGGMMWPDSVFVQFWEGYAEGLPGAHDDERMRGCYLQVHKCNGMSMMKDRAGRGHGWMRFEPQHRFQFHYDQEALRHRGYSEDGLSVGYWDGDAGTGQTVSHAQIDRQNSTLTFASAELHHYYGLTAPSAVTGVLTAKTARGPRAFTRCHDTPQTMSRSRSPAACTCCGWKPGICSINVRRNLVGRAEFSAATAHRHLPALRGRPSSNPF